MQEGDFEYQIKLVPWNCTEKLSSSALAIADRLRDIIGSWFGGEGGAPRSMHKNGGKVRVF